MQFPKYLSVVIPVYNEENRLGRALKIIKQWQQQQPGWEFILVSDGSIDRTEKIIKQFKFIKLITYPNNQGKGYALKKGVLKARRPLVLLCDIDFSTPLTELSKLFQKIASADMVIGSRKMAGAKIIQHQSWIRENLGRQFTNLTNWWLKTKVSDYTCGFKLLKLPAAKQLFSQQQIKRWCYDAEILFLAGKMKYKIAEVPVIWKNDVKTKVTLISDVWRSLIELWKIKFNQYE